MALVALTCLPMLIQLGLWQGVFALCSAMGELLGVGRLDKLFKALGGAMTMLLAMGCCLALLLVISIGLMLLLGGG